jgi:hypothetical protein
MRWNTGTYASPDMHSVDSGCEHNPKPRKGNGEKAAARAAKRRARRATPDTKAGRGPRPKEVAAGIADFNNGAFRKWRGD